MPRNGSDIAPFNLLFRRQTPMDVLAEWHELPPGLPPAGFVFHMSRCGSTLVAQRLAALPRTVVRSEAGPIDDVLRAPFRDSGVTDEQRMTWSQGMVSALGQPRKGNETHLFIKFDCWQTLDLALIKRAFPGVPWIFLYRDPVEVLISQVRQRGSQTVPTQIYSALFELRLASAVQMPPEEYCARAAASVRTAGVSALDGALNYSQRIEVVHLSESPVGRVHDAIPIDVEGLLVPIAHELVAVSGTHAEIDSVDDSIVAHVAGDTSSYR